MTKEDNSKVTIKYKEKEYEIEKKKDEQKVKPKGDANGTEITVKDYNEGSWNHTCECNGEKISIKWGKGRHITIWSGGTIFLILIGLGIYWYLKSQKQEEKEDSEDK